ncbi:hypothetical protein QLX08_005926 [Tetragonisca angustula]|uniref:Reverse transcriptase n=1 Tax=Tetragonisca angustula TaxID=166442 RepID=A0AAW0ZWA2_9HYME
MRRIGAETTAACQLDYGSNADTAQHTVEECPSFSQQRKRLKDVIGPDISLSAIIGALMRSKREEIAVTQFCEEIMTVKEVKQRSRENEYPVRQEKRRRRPSVRRRENSTVSE